MYWIFSGTTDYRDALFAFLDSDEIGGYTAMRTTSKWQGRRLGGDALVFFDKEDAEKTRAFLTGECHQQQVEILHIEAA